MEETASNSTSSPNPTNHLLHYFHVWRLFTRQIRYQKSIHANHCLLRDQIKALSDATAVEHQRPRISNSESPPNSLPTSTNRPTPDSNKDLLHSALLRRGNSLHPAGSLEPENKTLKRFQERAEERRRVHDELQRQRREREKVAAEAKRISEEEAARLRRETLRQTAAERREKQALEQQAREEKGRFREAQRKKESVARAFRVRKLMQLPFHGWKGCLLDGYERMKFAERSSAQRILRRGFQGWLRLTRNVIGEKTRKVELVFTKLFCRIVLDHWKLVIDPGWIRQRYMRSQLIFRRIGQRFLFTAWKTTAVDLQISRHLLEIDCRLILNRFTKRVLFELWMQFPALLLHQRARNLHLTRLITVVQTVLPDFAFPEELARQYEYSDGFSGATCSVLCDSI